MAETNILISFYADNDEIWNPKNTKYYKRNVRDRLMTQLQEKLIAECHFTVTVDEIKRKWSNLRTSYMREVRKLRQNKRSGVEGYVPKWVFYKDLLFLQDVGEPDESEDANFSQCSLPSDETLQMEPLVVNVRSLVSTDLLEDEEETNGESAESRPWSPILNESLCPASPDSGKPGTSEEHMSNHTPETRSHTWSQQSAAGPDHSAKMSLQNKASNLFEKPTSSLSMQFANWVGTYLEGLDEDSQISAQEEISHILFRYRPQFFNKRSEED